MSITFGYVVPAVAQKGGVEAWLSNVDKAIRNVEPYIHSLWMTDHFFWSDRPTFEAWTVVTYLATRYPQFNVGPIVLGQSYRNPALLAKMASTLQVLSNGRFIMAIGAGWKEDEYHAYGYPFPRAGIRLAQLEDMLEILTRLWKEPGQVTYEGEHYSIRDAYCEPKPDPVPPILVGGGGRKTMMLAARFADIWNVPDMLIDPFIERVQILHEHCETIGRDPATLDLSWFGRLAVGETEADALALSDGRWTPDNAIVGTVDQVQHRIQQYVDAGVTRFMFGMLDAETEHTRDLIQTVLQSFF